MRIAIATGVLALAPLGVHARAHADGYARSGAHEVGAAAGAMWTPTYHALTVLPAFGSFVADGIELSAMLGLSRIVTATHTATVWSALIEPSYHPRLARCVIGVLGFGLGAAYEHGRKTSLLIAPRIGVGFVVGRGIVTPSLQYQARTHAPLIDSVDTVTANVGYAVTW